MKTQLHSSMLARHVYLCAAVAFAAMAFVAQPAHAVEAWVQRYSHPRFGSFDYAHALVTDNAGNVVVAGDSDDGISGKDFLIIKYSGAGVPLWTNRYKGSPTAIAVDGSGNVFVTGSSYGGGSGDDYATIAYSGAGVPLWTNRYDGGLWSDIASAVAVDGSGNVFVTGRSYGENSWDYATVAYSSEGLPLWTHHYNGPGNGGDGASAIAVDGSGNVFVTGQSGSDYATIQYSGAGVPLWTNRYNGLGNSSDSATAIAVDGNGNVFVTGYSIGSRSGYDYATVAYSGAGVPLWTNRYDGANSDDQATAIAVDRSGNVFVTGSSATVAYSGAGVPLWTNRYDGLGNSSDSATAIGVDVRQRPAGIRFPYDRSQSAPAIAVDGSGNVFVTGYSSRYYGEYGSYYDYATVAYSGAGVPLWAKRYDGGYYNSASAIAVDGSGNVFVTGSSYLSSYDYATVAYSGAGMPLWVNRYDGPEGYSRYDFASAIAVDGSGNVFVTGQSYVSSDDSDYVTVVYSGAGGPLWVNRYRGRLYSYNSASALAVDGRGNVFVTGKSQGSGSGYDYVTIKYRSRRPYLTIEPDGGGGYFVRFNGIPGAAYSLERATSVTGPWAMSARQTAPASGRVEFRDFSPPPNEAFYRVAGP